MTVRHGVSGVAGGLALTLILTLTLTPALAQTPPGLDAIKRNARVSNRVETGLLLAEARPGKLFYFTGEDMSATVVLSNPTDQARSAQVRAWLEQGLDQRTAVRTQKVSVPTNSAMTVVLTWRAREMVPFGQALAVELVVDGEVVATGGDVFSTADNVWRVGLAGGHPVAFTAEHVKDLAGIERTVDAFRDRYINTFEKFFWAPDDFADMTPEQPEWFSGQARYHENLERLKHMCEYGRRIGVLPTTYGKSIGSGTAARDFIRANPEMVYGFGGVMSYIPDTEELARWDVVSEKGWQSTAWAQYNMNDPAVVQHGIDEIIASTRQFGWDGVRFDGHFQARSGKQRVGDRIVEFTADMADAQTAANHKALKEQALKVFPRYAFGYNYSNCGLDQRFQSNLRETIELCRGGGHIMDEYAKANHGGAHPYRRWADFAALMVRQTEQVRRLGGELFPMTSGQDAVGRYQMIFTLAAGAHPNCNYPVVAYNRFAARYGELFWAPNVRNVWNPLGLVVIRPGVMWQDYVREQRLDERHRRLIVHLINPPVQETATETAAAEAEVKRREQRRAAIRTEAGQRKAEPDYGEIDRLPPIELAPPPQRDIVVRIVPEAMDGGWKPVRAWLLSPDDGSRRAMPVDMTDPYFWRMVVPELTTWSIVVVELEVK